MLTIIIPVYNGARTIQKALDSILFQKTSFNYSILIVNDCSTDNTQDIIEEYKVQYSDKIKIIKHEVNKGCFHARITGYQAIKTKYFTILDCDDYWITENKIQKALEFLEKNNDYTMYMSNTFLEREGKRDVYINSESKTISHASQYIPAHTSAVIYRNVFTKNDFIKFTKIEYENEKFFDGETFYNHLHLDRGKAYFNNEVTSVYSMTGEGIWTRLSRVEQSFLNAFIWYKFQKYFFPQSVYFLEKTYNALPGLLQHQSELSLEQIKEIYAFHFTFYKYLNGCSFTPTLHNKIFYLSAPSINSEEHKLIIKEIALYLSDNLGYSVFCIDYEDGAVANLLKDSGVKMINYEDNMDCLELEDHAHFFAPAACIEKLPKIDNSTIHHLFWYDNPFDYDDTKDNIVCSTEHCSTIDSDKTISKKLNTNSRIDLNIKNFLLAFLQKQKNTHKELLNICEHRSNTQDNTSQNQPNLGFRGQLTNVILKILRKLKTIFMCF